VGLGYLEHGKETKRKEGGYNVGWPTFCVAMQFFYQVTCIYMLLT
jgi:hypothetical protein